MSTESRGSTGGEGVVLCPICAGGGYDSLRNATPLTCSVCGQNPSFLRQYEGQLTLLETA